mmetsp:Transcript_36816/g.113605  ORF Transcript_36816/g.113605 Transcript_36816/m.113605 type:complete len:209 (-) Transcript_36816:34-660(-)
MATAAPSNGAANEPRVNDPPPPATHPAATAATEAAANDDVRCGDMLSRAPSPTDPHERARRWKLPPRAAGDGDAPRTEAKDPGLDPRRPPPSVAKSTTRGSSNSSVRRGTRCSAGHRWARAGAMGHSPHHGPSSGADTGVATQFVHPSRRQCRQRKRGKRWRPRWPLAPWPLRSSTRQNGHCSRSSRARGTDAASSTAARTALVGILV